MANVALAPAGDQVTGQPASMKQYEFLAFSVIGFVAKSILLIRLPYREWYVNTIWTVLLISFFYCFFRFRFKVTPPVFVIFSMFLAVGMDMIGNLLGFYKQTPLFWIIRYDEFTHVAGSACALVPVMWVFRTTTRRLGFKLPADMTAFICTCITFSLCSYYEILELWDELIWNHNYRIWSTHDTPEDLQWDLVGIVLAAFIGFFYYRFKDRRNEDSLVKA
jgi:uncharacterized membrane protein YjdF